MAKILQFSEQGNKPKNNLNKIKVKINNNKTREKSTYTFERILFIILLPYSYVMSIFSYVLFMLFSILFWSSQICVNIALNKGPFHLTITDEDINLNNKNN